MRIMMTLIWIMAGIIGMLIIAGLISRVVNPRETSEFIEYEKVKLPSFNPVIGYRDRVVFDAYGNETTPDISYSDDTPTLIQCSDPTVISQVIVVWGDLRESNLSAVMIHVHDKLKSEHSEFKNARIQIVTHDRNGHILSMLDMSEEFGLRPSYFVK